MYLERLRAFIDRELPAYWSVRTAEPLPKHSRAMSLNLNGTSTTSPDSGRARGQGDGDGDGGRDVVVRQPMAGYANAALGASLEGSLATATSTSYEARGKRGSTTSSIKSTRSNESAATTGTTVPLVHGSS